MRPTTPFFSFMILITSLTANAGPSLEALMYRGFGHEESNRLFLAKIELGKAHSDVARAQYLHDKNVKLRERKAIAEFEYMDSLMRLMESTFAEKRAIFHVIEAEAREKIWNLHLESLTNGKGATKAAAGLYMEIAIARKKVFESLTAALVPYVALITEEFQRSERMAATRALTDSDLHKITTLKNDFVGLQELAARELEKANAQVITAEVDLSEASRPVDSSDVDD